MTQGVISASFIHSAAINAPSTPSSTFPFPSPPTEEIMDSLSWGEGRVCLPVQLGSFLSVLQLCVTSWRSCPLQFHNAKGPWPVCPHTWIHTAPTGNRWLCRSCLHTYSNIYLILSFTHYLRFGEEFIHLSASDPSQGFHRWTFIEDLQSNTHL